MASCYKCKNECTFKDDKGLLFGYPCDICKNVVCADCAGTSPSEVRVLIMKTRSLLHFCPDCIDRMFKNILKINQKMSGMEEEIKKLKNLNKLDEVEKRVKKVEDDVRKMKQTKNDELKVKATEDCMDMNIPGRGVEANKPSQKEVSEIQQTLNGHMKKIAHNIEELTVNFKKENIELVKAITSSFKEGNNELLRSLTNDPPSASRSSANRSKAMNTISSQNLGHAMLEAATRETLDKYINITTDADVEKQKTTKTAYNGPAENYAKVIKGSNKEISSISAAEDCKVFYVGNLSVETSMENLKSFLIENGIPVIACDQIVPNRQRSTPIRLAYRVMVKPEFERNILNANLWPSNITVKPYTDNRYHDRNFQRKRPQTWLRR